MMQLLWNLMERKFVSSPRRPISNTTVWGKLITNFAGPMNNFILGVIVFWILIFMQGGVRDTQSNNFSIISDSAIAKVGLENTAQITKVGSHEISNWEDLIQGSGSRDQG